VRCAARLSRCVVTAYELGRIADQQDWYADKATFNRGRSDLWRTGVLALEFVGLVLGLVAIAFAAAAAVDFIGVIAALAAAAMAWLQVKQHETMARAYAVASGELASIRSLTRHQGSEDD
jgi:SMODS and SLOG-associating 2TM effector domain 1